MEGTPVERLDWLRSVIRQCSAKAAAIAAEIDARWNKERGMCFPSHAQLAADAGVSEDTVIRAIRELRSKGALRVKESHGRGFSNEYSPIWEFGRNPRRLAGVYGQETPAELRPPSPANRTPETPAELRPQLIEENSLKRTREDIAPAQASTQPEIDPAETMASASPVVFSDTDLIRPLAGYVRTSTNDPERTQELRAELAALVRDLTAQQALALAYRAWQANSRQKVWPSAIAELAAPSVTPTASQSITAPVLNLPRRRTQS